MIFIIPIIISILTPEIRSFLEIDEMNRKQILALLIFIFICSLIWLYVLWPGLRTDFPPFNTIEDDTESQLEFSNISLQVDSDGKITLRTVINAFDNGVKRPLKNLKPTNFLIIEHSENIKQKAQVIQAKPMASPVRIIVLIDNSRSMWGQARKDDDLTKIDVVKEAVKTFYLNLENSKISSVNSAPSYIAFLPFSEDGVYFLEKNSGGIWFPALPESRVEITNIINSLNPDGRTPMYDGIDHALDVITLEKDSRYKILFCLTDEIDNNSEVRIEELLLKLNNYNIPVITAGYGSSEEIDEENILDIALESGAGGENVGAFFNVSSQELPIIFSKILQGLNSTYEMSWYSTFSNPGQKVTSEIQASYVSITGKKTSPIIKKSYQLPLQSND